MRALRLVHPYLRIGSYELNRFRYKSADWFVRAISISLQVRGLVRTSYIDFVTSPRMVRTSYFHFVTSPRMVRTSYFHFVTSPRIAIFHPSTNHPSMSYASIKSLHVLQFYSDYSFCLCKAGIIGPPKRRYI